jgi:soluble lytic murein transglycosylase-like protein
VIETSVEIAKSVAKQKAKSWLWRFILANIPILLPIALIAILLIAIFSSFLMLSMSEPTTDDFTIPGMTGSYEIAPGGTAVVSKDVLRWEPLVRKYAKQYGLESYVGILLALIQQESSGTQLDVMQSSESIGLPPGAITDPEYSIQVGMKHFDKVLRMADGDIRLALQSYNFGTGFIDYAKARGGYSKEVAIAFSRMQAAKLGWSRYGDVNYVDHVLRYYKGSLDTVPAGGGNGTQSFDFNAVHNIMRQYLGWDYIWGGRSPKAGGFDCSGLMEYAFGKVGKDLSGTAATQFNKTVPVAESQIQPGDLVFFSTIKAGPSHVGMYVGDGKFINSNDKGVQYSSVATWKKIYPFLGFRRVK